MPENNQQKENKDLQNLENALNSGRHQMTIGDAAAASSLSLEDAKRALDGLLNKYYGKLQVTDQGDLIYDFGETPKRRDEKSMQERWEQFLAWSWKAFKVTYKVWIAVTLVFYFVFFAIVLIGLIVAQFAATEDGDGDSIGFTGFLLIGDLFRAIFFAQLLMPDRYTYEVDEHGYRYRRYLNKGEKEGKGKNFVTSVYDFVFGPARIEHDSEENAKEIAAYLRQKQGLLVKSEIQGLTGMTNEKADDFFAQFSAKFNGKPTITENAVLLAEYEELARSVDKSKDAKVTWFWDEYEAPFKLTGNSSGRNAGIIFMNLFNMTMAGTITYQVLVNPNNIALLDNWMAWVFGFVPLTFSTIFFGVPLARSFKIKKKNQQRHIQNIKKRLMKFIFQSDEGKVLTDDLTETVNTQAKKGEEKLPKETVENVMNELVLDMGGEMEINEEAKTEYHFETLNRELKEVEKLRSERTKDDDNNDDNDLGKVIFDTDEEGT